MISIICADSHLNGNVLSESHDHLRGVSGAESRPPQPYDDKCSNQEGVKVGRPTPYIGAPSDVNFILFLQWP